MKPLIFSMFTPTSFQDVFNSTGQFDFGKLTVREFPDQESYIRFDTDVSNRNIIIIASLDKPNPKILPLLFALQTARELGVKKIGLVVPYLPYMRQDKRFLPGEAITSRVFSKIIGDYADWLVTVDPHLHRYRTLDEIYKIPTQTLHATHPIANWVQKHVTSPIIIGPDSESEQWVSTLSKEMNAPFSTLEKVRIDDEHVQIKFPDLNQFKAYTPVLVDDIISTGTTMIETIKHLQQIKMPPPICIGVHAIFANNAYENIIRAGAKTVITCNTIAHTSNSIDIALLMAKSVMDSQSE